MSLILSKETWLERFATQLRLLRPQLSALEAAYVAMDEFVACEFDPKGAAATYVGEVTGEAHHKRNGSVTAPMARRATNR